MQSLKSRVGLHSGPHAMDRPELGERSMLGLIAATSPHQLPSFTAALDAAISQWMSMAKEESFGGMEQELARLHALKSVTSALGSAGVALACDALSDCLRSGTEARAVRRRACALALSAQRLLHRATTHFRMEGG
ncbi:hypothetical protein [Stenotrophomonas maltophilia]|nr:hypothetical protein [Stenotrophomonas maltophilia]KOQ67417.1 hypothetical protein ABW42_01535 [Stenotrophomonas maltophilia]MCF3528790.1 hypothetical protein [Stenotrophomonas maltophilia]MCF3532674.1 hypothetical protein [Stenotrophomonas maltophilia]MCO7486046.1 hypothetical protein [Stenotrophomonas maltophilia]